MGKATKDDYRGDFGWTEKAIQKVQVVGIFDLVGFTSHKSNDDLVAAVSYMDTRIKLGLGDEYFWGERTRGGWEAERNEVLLRSTGDGYVVAFSQDESDFDALQILLKIYKGIRTAHRVQLGINKGHNYIVTDVNGLVNIIGWGINCSARALQFAENSQIVCTEYFAKPILKTHGNEISDKHMISFGEQTVKKTKMELFNYYKKGEFGAPPVKSQIR